MADFQSNIAFIKGSEGGLSRATTDSASKNPCPCPYNGQTGWHTNKGVTWTTFVSLGKQLGYDPSCDNFFAMPDAIWQKIYRYGYWNPMSGDSYKSQAIANNVVEIAWGSGVGGAMKVMKGFLQKNYGVTAATSQMVSDSINKLTAKTDKDVFNKLIQARADFYRSLNQPANLPGWLARLDRLRQRSLSLLYENKVVVGGGLLFFFTLGRSILEA